MGTIALAGLKAPPLVGPISQETTPTVKPMESGGLILAVW